MARNCRSSIQDGCVGPEDVDVIELHDCFSCNELVTYVVFESITHIEYENFTQTQARSVASLSGGKGWGSHREW